MNRPTFFSYSLFLEKSKQKIGRYKALRLFFSHQLTLFGRIAPAPSHITHDIVHPCPPCEKATDIIPNSLKQFMIKKSILCVIMLLSGIVHDNNSFAQYSGEKHLSNQTFTYDEVIESYTALDKKYEQAKFLSYGNTDIGQPLHLFVISKEKDFDPASLKNKNKRIILINNAIHPGEPCGVDASLKLSEDLLDNDKLASHLENLIICIIPVYNVDGVLNRGCCSRANQNGPEEYGFRGNARNLDLNRDFIKCDSENAKTFTKIFLEWDPDVFVDTHTSNGADYQYVMTLIATQHNKLQPSLGNYMQQVMVPELYRNMKDKKYEMSPYVNTFKEIPDDGIVGFMETPRYSTGYTALFNTIGFVTEAHMFKSYKERVQSTYEFLASLTAFVNREHKKIGEIRLQAKQAVISQNSFPVAWMLDTTKIENFIFKGYEAKYKTSNISGMQRLYYDREAPYEKQVPFYNEYKAEITVQKPEMYIIPQAWKEVIERLKWNKVKLKRLSKDTLLNAEVYYITDYKTAERPYEGHYLHSKVQVRTETQKINYYKGDYVVEVNQESNRYIIETLEPQATDSYFAWNFFDEILQQKEWFSDYIFEEKAEEILIQNPSLKKELDEKKMKELTFANNHWAQLFFIYQNSVYYEKTYLRYPVTRLNNQANLALE